MDTKRDKGAAQVVAGALALAVWAPGADESKKGNVALRTSISMAREGLEKLDALNTRLDEAKGKAVYKAAAAELALVLQKHLWEQYRFRQAYSIQNEPLSAVVTIANLLTAVAKKPLRSAQDASIKEIGDMFSIEKNRAAIGLALAMLVSAIGFSLPALAQSASDQQTLRLRHIGYDPQTKVDMFFDSALKGKGSAASEGWFLVSAKARTPTTDDKEQPAMIAGSIHWLKVDCIAGVAQSDLGFHVLADGRMMGAGNIQMTPLAFTGTPSAVLFEDFCEAPARTDQLWSLAEAVALTPTQP